MLGAGGAARRAQSGFGLVAQGDVCLDRVTRARGKVSAACCESRRERVADRGRGRLTLIALAGLCRVCFTWWPVSLDE